MARVSQYQYGPASARLRVRPCVSVDSKLRSHSWARRSRPQLPPFFWRALRQATTTRHVPPVLEPRIRAASIIVLAVALSMQQGSPSIIAIIISATGDKENEGGGS